MSRAGPRRRHVLLVAIVAIVALAAACSPAPSPTPEPSPTPRPAPSATPETMPPGPITGQGLLGRATYLTPTGYAPAFAFDLRSDGWRSVTDPDELGFVLANPNLVNVDAIIGLGTPVAATLDAFTEELATNGWLDGSETEADLVIDGVPARSFTVTSATSHEAFRLVVPDGDVLTSFGGEDLPENRLVYIAHPAGPVVLIFDLEPNGDPELRFAFARLLETIEFR